MQSYSLVPDADPTLMFVNASMVRFKIAFFDGWPRGVLEFKATHVSGSTHVNAGWQT